MSETAVLRRFPSYDFAIRTGQDVRTNAVLLQRFLNDQTKSRRFTLYEPRFVGTFDGTSFSLHPVYASFEIPFRAVAEGHFIPNESGGSDVIVRVRASRFMYVVLILVFVAAATAAIQQALFSLQGFVVVLFLFGFITAFLFLLVAVEGPRTRRTLEDLFKRRAAV